METIIGKEFPQKVIPLIDEAKFSIDIVVFDWRWYPQDPGKSVQLFNQALVRAVRRGVNVRAITNTEEIISTLKNIGIKAKKFFTQRLIHAKFMIIDNETLIIGSHNYTEHGFDVNYEVSIIYKGREEIKPIIDFFNNIYG
jgi:phosphatidylserine/phosphatidylglycerophosphate/cardiolipin synthase-like enzyme